MPALSISFWSMVQLAISLSPFRGLKRRNGMQRGHWYLWQYPIFLIVIVTINPIFKIAAISLIRQRVSGGPSALFRPKYAHSLTFPLTSNGKIDWVVMAAVGMEEVDDAGLPPLLQITSRLKSGWNPGGTNGRTGNGSEQNPNHGGNFMKWLDVHFLWVFAPWHNTNHGIDTWWSRGERWGRNSLMFYSSLINFVKVLVTWILGKNCYYRLGFRKWNRSLNLTISFTFLKFADQLYILIEIIPHMINVKNNCSAI